MIEVLLFILNLGNPEAPICEDIKNRYSVEVKLINNSCYVRNKEHYIHYKTFLLYSTRQYFIKSENSY